MYTHWKDAKYQFKGLPLNLNDKAITYIKKFLEYHEVIPRNVIVYKWDLHKFNINMEVWLTYINFPSFAPPSNWVQHNFWDSYSWYALQVIEKNWIAHTPDFIPLNYKKRCK